MVSTIVIYACEPKRKKMDYKLTTETQSNKYQYVTFSKAQGSVHSTKEFKTRCEQQIKRTCSNTLKKVKHRVTCFLDGKKERQEEIDCK